MDNYIQSCIIVNKELATSIWLGTDSQNRKFEHLFLYSCMETGVGVRHTLNI